MMPDSTFAALGTADLEIVVPCAGLQEDAVAYLRHMLSAPRETLEHGATFTGRPTTLLYRNPSHVVKVRTEYRFRSRDARRWIDRTAALERRFKVHHPDKGWFLLHGQETSLIANITPLMAPLHHRLGEVAPSEQHAFLERLLAMYLRVASQEARRLDEGLSNFAVAADGTLYYVDDDTYEWDGFLSLSHALGFWCRAYPWYTEAVAGQLGTSLRRLLVDTFRERHTVPSVAGLLRRVSLFTPAQKQRREAMLQGLEESTSQPSHRPAFSQEPIALLADIHANYPALQAVLHAIESLGVRQALVLGDTVGYGPHPREVIHALRERRFVVLQGNHDYAVAEGQYQHGFSLHARHVAAWTREHLLAEELAWLAALPPMLQHDEWLAVHGAPQDPKFFFGYVYQTTYPSNLENLMARDIPYCFHGHSHIAGVYFRSKRGLLGHSGKVQQSLQQYSHCLVNPGSVGQPRENNGSAARFAVFTPAEKVLHFHHALYDVDATVRDMLANGFPLVLAQRLCDGV